MKDLLRNALKLADVDYCEIRFEESQLLSISYQGRTLDTITRDQKANLPRHRSSKTSTFPSTLWTPVASASVKK